jgi:hypothetical protein
MKNEGLSLDLIQANPSETAKSGEPYLEPRGQGADRRCTAKTLSGHEAAEETLAVGSKPGAASKVKSRKKTSAKQVHLKPAKNSRPTGFFHEGD